MHPFIQHNLSQLTHLITPPDINMSPRLSSLFVVYAVLVVVTTAASVTPTGVVSEVDRCLMICLRMFNSLVSTRQP